MVQYVWGSGREAHPPIGEGCLSVLVQLCPHRLAWSSQPAEEGARQGGWCVLWPPSSWPGSKGGVHGEASRVCFPGREDSGCLVRFSPSQGCVRSPSPTACQAPGERLGTTAAVPQRRRSFSLTHLGTSFSRGPAWPSTPAYLGMRGWRAGAAQQASALHLLLSSSAQSRSFCLERQERGLGVGSLLSTEFRKQSQLAGS